MFKSTAPDFVLIWPLLLTHPSENTLVMKLMPGDPLMRYTNKILPVVPWEEMDEMRKKKEELRSDEALTAAKKKEIEEMISKKKDAGFEKTGAGSEKTDAASEKVEKDWSDKGWEKVAAGGAPGKADADSEKTDEASKKKADAASEKTGEASEKKTDAASEKTDAASEKTDEASTKPGASAKADKAGYQPRNQPSRKAPGTGKLVFDGNNSFTPGRVVEPFGQENAADQLQGHAARTQDILVDAMENAEVAEVKRTVYRTLTRLRSAQVKEYDTIARREIEAVDKYNDIHDYRSENPLSYLDGIEKSIYEDKFFSFHE